MTPIDQSSRISDALCAAEQFVGTGSAFAPLAGNLSRSNQAMPHATKSVTILKPREEVYEFWHDVENLGRFMQHLELVEDLGGGRSHWVAKAPAGMKVEWDAAITADVPGERIAWKSLPGSDVTNSGSVVFRTAPGDRGTELTVHLEYEVPGGAAAAMVAKLFGEEPSQQLRDDLRRFKQIMETGEIVRSDGSLGGAGQGALKQRHAQPADAPNRSPETQARP